jgi:uncharacterized protein with PhoU and TrkA domain
MACFETGTVVSLSPREAITLPHVGGSTLRVTKGTVWLTEERGRDDIVLRPGDNWLVESNGNTVIEAYDGAVLCIIGRKGALPRAAAQQQHDRRPALSALLAYFTVMPRHAPYF